MDNFSTPQFDLKKKKPFVGGGELAVKGERKETIRARSYFRAGR